MSSSPREKINGCSDLSVKISAHTMLAEHRAAGSNAVQESVRYFKFNGLVMVNKYFSNDVEVLALFVLMTKCKKNK